MRDYGKVYSTFWSSSTTGGMSDDAKMLALYLMTCSHSTISGAFRLPDGYVSEDLGWASERVAKGFAELFAKGFANRCGTTKWVWVCKHLEWNKPENPNQRKAASKIAASIPDECAWKREFWRVCGEVLALEPLQDRNPSETVAKPFINQKQEQEQEQEDNPPTPQGGCARFEDFWSAWPKSERKQDKVKCAKKWRTAGLDQQADAILADIAVKRKTKKWADGFVEAPLVYLNGQRWKDGVTPEAGGEQSEGVGVFV